MAEPAARDEIGELARTMNGMLARIEDSAVRQRRFVADASHELRTPLAAIRTTLEVGLARPERAPWNEIAERVMRQSARLESLVEQLLLLARSDDRHLVQARRPVAIDPLALGLALAKEIATAHGGSITIADAPGGGALVRIVLPRAAD